MTKEEALAVVENELWLTQSLIDMKENGQLPSFELERNREWSDALTLAIDALKMSILIEAVGETIGTRDFSVPETPPILHSHCIRCGKALKNPKAQERGYGEICWQKHLSDNQQALF